MRRDVLPLFETRIQVFYGEREWKAYSETIAKEGADPNPKEPWDALDGQQWGTWIWIRKRKDVATAFHEGSHYVDSVLEHTRIRDDETRAYITQWVMWRLMTWAQEGSAK